MTIEKSHGKKRVTRPRRTDRSDAARQPRRQRAPNGEFIAGNDIGRGRGWKAAFRTLLDMMGETEPELLRIAQCLYRGATRELAHTNPFSHGDVISWVQRTIFSVLFARQAIREGIETKKGQELAKLSREHDDLRGKAAVAALDFAKAPLGSSSKTQTPTDKLIAEVMGK